MDEKRTKWSRSGKARLRFHAPRAFGRSSVSTIAAVRPSTSSPPKTAAVWNTPRIGGHPSTLNRAANASTASASATSSRTGWTAAPACSSAYDGGAPAGRRTRVEGRPLARGGQIGATDEDDASRPLGDQPVRHLLADGTEAAGDEVRAVRFEPQRRRR